MQEARIKIGVDAGELDAAFIKMNRVAKQNVAEIIANARAYSVSSKEVLSSINEEISAREKLSKLEYNQQMYSINKKQERGTVGGKAYDERVKEIKGDYEQNMLITQLMKDIIDTLKTESKVEISENRKNVEKQILESKTVDVLGPEGNQEEVLKETIKKDLIDKDKKPNKEEEEQNRRMDKRDLAAIIASNLIGPMMHMGQQLAGAKNANYFIGDAMGGLITASSGLLSQIPFAGKLLGPLAAGGGALVSTVMNRGLSAAEEFEKSAGGYYRVTGRSVGEAGRSYLEELIQSEVDRRTWNESPALPDRGTQRSDATNRITSTKEGIISTDSETELMKFNQGRKTIEEEVRKKYQRDLEEVAIKDLSQFGLNKTEYLQAKAGYARANVYEGRLNVDSSILAERGLGLDRGQLSDYAKTLRRAGISAGTGANELAGTLIGRGANRDEVRAYLPEYLNTLISVNRQQLLATGKVENGINTKLVASIAGLNESFKNPEVLAKMVTSLTGGLTNASTPQVEALQFNTLNRINPGASLWDLRKMQKDPFGAGKTYLPDFLKSMINISGSKDESYFNIASTFGLENSPQLVEDLVEGIKSGKYKNADDIKLKSQWGLSKEASVGRGTSYMESQTKSTDNFFIDAGQKMVVITSEILGVLKDILGDKKQTPNVVKK